jgi:colicin import membrane protein
MPTSNEDSVLFSLRGLMQMEHERVQEEEDAKLRAARESRERAETARRREDEARAAQAQAAQQALAAERALAAAREEQHRRAREQAELRIRVEAETRERERGLHAQLEHQQRLAVIAAGQRRSMPTGVVAGVTLGLLAVLAGGGYFGVVQPMRARAAAEVEAVRTRAVQAEGERQRLAAEVAASGRRAEEAEQARRRAQGEAEAARAHADAARLAVRAAPAQNATPSVSRRRPTVRPPTTGGIDGPIDLGVLPD